jgi:mannose-6-phosphate isomerase-like protein (cupin superfamily)
MENVKGFVRRIVTGHDENGLAIITEDGAAPSVHTNPKREGFYLTNLWVTHETPVPINNDPDPTSAPLQLEPPKNGSVVRIIEFGPEGEWLKKLDNDGAKTAFGAMGTDKASTFRPGGHPLMHRTESVDYALILEGEIYLVLDKEERLMKTGDFLVERGTNHAWANRSGKFMGERATVIERLNSHSISSLHLLDFRDSSHGSAMWHRWFAQRRQINPF